MDLENNVEGQLYYLTSAMTLQINPFFLEKSLIYHEITIQMALDLANLGLRVYEGALAEIESFSDEVFNVKKPVYKDFLLKGQKSFQDFISTIDDRKKIPKIEFQKGVAYIDAAMLLKALQENWLTPQQNDYWLDYFEFPGDENERKPGNMSKQLSKYKEPVQLFTEFLLKPRMTNANDFNELKEFKKLREYEREKKKEKEREAKEAKALLNNNRKVHK